MIAQEENEVRKRGLIGLEFNTIGCKVMYSMGYLRHEIFPAFEEDIFAIPMETVQAMNTMLITWLDVIRISLCTNGYYHINRPSVMVLCARSASAMFIKDKSGYRFCLLKHGVKSAGT